MANTGATGEVSAILHQSWQDFEDFETVFDCLWFGWVSHRVFLYIFPWRIGIFSNDLARSMSFTTTVPSVLQNEPVPGGSEKSRFAWRIRDDASGFYIVMGLSKLEDGVNLSGNHHPELSKNFGPRSNGRIEKWGKWWSTMRILGWCRTHGESEPAGPKWLPSIAFCW